MPQSTVVTKSSVTRRQAEPVPSDMAERLEQLKHHQAVTADASTGAEPAQDRAPEQARQTAGEASTATPEPAPVPKAKYDSHALQAAFLAGNLNRPVVIFLVNGLRLTGKLRQFDQFTLLLEGQDRISSMVFKHAISMIAPASEAPGKQY